MIFFFFISSSLLFSFLRFSLLFSSLVLSLLLHVSFSFSLFLLLFSLFFFSSSLFSLLFSPSSSSSLSSSLSLSFTAHTETRSTRQVTPPTKNRHAPRDPLNQERAINLSIPCYVTTWEVLHVLSQIKPQAPLPVLPIRPCLIFMLNVLSALPGFGPPPFSRDTVYRKIIDRKLFGRMSNSTHAAYIFDGAYFQHMHHSCGT